MGVRSNSESDVGRVVVLDVLGLQPQHLEDGLAPNLAALFDEHDGGGVTKLRPPFPALTVPVQTTLGEGRSPRAHGDVANGEYDRETDTVEFWDRSRGDRNRLWESVTDATDLTTGVLFFQHLKGTSADVAVTPSPIEDEDNNLLEMNCWTNPDGFYADLQDELGHFPLLNYWGPMANEQSSTWILDAAERAVDWYDPDLLWVYVPHLDYSAQRHGPDAEETLAEVSVVDELVGEFLDVLRNDNRWPETAVNVVSEYGFHEVDRAVLPNVALREAGLLETRTDDTGGLEVDLQASDAFAMVDHQIAHVYVSSDAVDAAKSALTQLPGIDLVIEESTEKAAYDIDHSNAGDLVLLADSDAWFQYYWWEDNDEPPAYAIEMDIHSKPGFDPCELFPGDRGIVSLDPSDIEGSHGIIDDDTLAFYGLGGPAAPSMDLPMEVDARAVAPTIASLLSVTDDLNVDFEVEALPFE